MEDGSEEVDGCAADWLGGEEVVGGVGDARGWGGGLLLSESGGDGAGGVLDYEAEVGEGVGEGEGCVACGTADLCGVRSCRVIRGEENVHLPPQLRRVGKPSRSP